MYVCMYVCMHACMYVCMHACMYACMHVCMYACMHACMYARMHACRYACMHVCMYACMHVCMYACMHVCICMHMYVYIYIYIMCVVGKTPINVVNSNSSFIFPMRVCVSENGGRLLPGRVNRENDDSPVGQLTISQSLAFPMLDASPILALHFLAFIESHHTTSLDSSTNGGYISSYI